MKFSIVITTYNRLDLLKRAIDSALNQTVPCEVVVADNASTDGTEAYMHSLGERVRYVRNPTNLNHAGAVNTGVEAATGEWIKLLDDDDYLAPNCVEVMMDAIAHRPQSVICSCQSAQVTVNEQELSRTLISGPGQLFYIPQEAIHYGMLLDQVPFGTPVQVAIRRDAFVQSGGWDVSMTYFCDEIDSWLRVAQFGDALFINRCLAYRTVWPGNYNTTLDVKKRYEINVLIKERIYERVSPAYRDQLPPLATTRNYLRLHWGLVALKQRQVSQAFAIALPAVASPAAWRLLYQARQLRRRQGAVTTFPKIALVP
ncbi:MAG TPA: glycosyltransferase family 2 protein [Trichocoleus sp.]